MKIWKHAFTSQFIPQLSILLSQIGTRIPTYLINIMNRVAINNWKLRLHSKTISHATRENQNAGRKHCRKEHAQANFLSSVPYSAVTLTTGKLERNKRKILYTDSLICIRSNRAIVACSIGFHTSTKIKEVRSQTVDRKLSATIVSLIYKKATCLR